MRRSYKEELSWTQPRLMLTPPMSSGDFEERNSIPALKACAVPSHTARVPSHSPPWPSLLQSWDRPASAGSRRSMSYARISGWYYHTIAGRSACLEVDIRELTSSSESNGAAIGESSRLDKQTKRSLAETLRISRN